MNGGPRPSRQGGGGHGERSSDRNGDRSGDASSADHRRKLEALFGGGGSPSIEGAAPTNGSNGRAQRAPTERVFSSPRRSLGRSPSEYRLRLERLRMARDVEEIRGAADAFLQHHQLPDDPDVLTKVMQHPTEKVVREAMGQISALLMQGRMPATLILEERLRELDQRAAEDATRSYIKGIQAQLASMKK